MVTDRARMTLGAVGVSAAGALLILSGCQGGSTAYVNDRAAGYVISKGEVVKVERIISFETEALSDGGAMPIGKDGAVVTMRFGPSEDRIVLNAGDILVQTDDADWVLQKRPE